MIIRTQNDGASETASDAARIDCSTPKLVRPEFGPDTDIRTILRRHTGIPTARREPIYTETDHAIDLQQAITNLRRAHAAFEALPQKYRDKYHSADELWRAHKHGFTEDFPNENTGSPAEPLTSATETPK